MISRKRSKIVTRPFAHNEHIAVHYEYLDGDDTVVVGDKIKFNGTRGTFKFLKHVVNAEREVEWIDCMDLKTGEFRSFYTSRLKHKVKPKRKRRKRFQIEQAAKVAKQEALVITQSNRNGSCSKCKCELTDSTAAPSIVKRGSGYCRNCMKDYIASKKGN